MLKEQELCYRITGCAYEVYRHLGHGFLESIYHNSLCHELAYQGLRFESEMPVDILYKGKRVGQHRLDLLVEDKIIVELKAQSQLPASAKPQLINYLKATSHEVGLLVNFTFPRAVVKRIVL